MNTIASRDQFKPIRIGENLVVNYKIINEEHGFKFRASRRYVFEELKRKLAFNEIVFQIFI